MERNFENFSMKRGGQRAEEIWELQVTVFKTEHSYGRLSKERDVQKCSQWDGTRLVRMRTKSLSDASGLLGGFGRGIESRTPWHQHPLGSLVPIHKGPALRNSLIQGSLTFYLNSGFFLVVENWDKASVNWEGGDVAAQSWEGSTGDGRLDLDNLRQVMSFSRKRVGLSHLSIM